MTDAHSTPSLLSRLGANPSEDDILDAFVDWAAEANLTLYPAQEEAIVELLAGNHVILDTPTGSGKSMVALAAQFAALAAGKRSYYTAPIKALVSEKFFALCRDLGTHNVGMITGDASVNPDAPVICCTAEILANIALRDGAGADVDVVVMDEFHFYSEPSRGWAWQVPLIELTSAQFLLMSATLGPVKQFQEDLERRTGVPCTLVRKTERPVPLDFAYRYTALHESIADLQKGGLLPVYLVHFTQANATEQAQALTSIALTTKDEKEAIKDTIAGFRFDTPFGADLRRYLNHGIGVHHAGMLPKYRLLVEKLAQEGQLKVICGTDTLGVGINVPIRTVLFTQLCKYDGTSTRVLQVREFRQIAGRAGRAGYDDRGYVWAQAPEHVVENRKADEAAANDPKKKKKVKRKPPEFGYAAWNEETFERYQSADPETLKSSFEVTHAMMLNLLDRPGDGCAAVKRLLDELGEPRKRYRHHVRRAIAIYRSLKEQGILETLDAPDDLGRRVRINVDLQAEFRLNQPLSPWIVDAVIALDRDHPDYAADVLSIVEAVIEDPNAVLARQREKVKDELMFKMRSEGAEYDERMAALAEATHPMPNADFLYGVFNAWRTHHPWVADTIHPKSVARDLYERGTNVRDYIRIYGLKRSEGVLLRYLTDAYKTLVQTVPMAASTEEIDELIDWLAVTIKAVDSSLIEEWERLTHPDDDAPANLGSVEIDITTNLRAFRVMVRNTVFSWVQTLARKRYDELPDPDAARAAMAPYWEEFTELRTDSASRGAAWFQVDEGTAQWRIRQTLLDPDEHAEWYLEAVVDLPRSREEERPVVELVKIART